MDARLFLSILAVIFSISGNLPAVEPAVFSSPVDLWRGFDPTALPLEMESLKTWIDDGCAFEKLRFTAEVVDGARVRVFAIQGAPAKGPRQPGILHIHGGGQTASLDWVRFWTRRGYVCATFDFCGPWADRTEVTDWGPIKHANMAEAQGGFQVEPTPRASSWYHWTLASRRALTLLANHPRVDAERLGIFGISVGGTLCWSMAGSDARVKTAVPIYGCGYNIDRRRTRWGFPELTPQLALFQRVVSPEAHAPYVSCPLLFLNATNDFHGWMDTAYDILSATTGAHWQAMTPRYNHHVAPAQGNNLPAWMEFQLKKGPAFPQSPVISLSLAADGIPQASLDSNRDEIDHVDFYYSLNDKPPPSRYWRSAKSQTDAHSFNWRANLEVLDAWEKLFAFANVYYKSGICLTTNLAQCIPGQIGKARATLRHGDTFEPHAVAESWFYATAYTDPNVSKQFVSAEDLPERPAVLVLNKEIFGDRITVNLASHIVGDPQFVGSEGSDIALDCMGGFDNEGLRVTMTEHDWTPRARSYSATIPVSELSDGWKTVKLSAGQFRTADGQALTTWRDLDKIQLQATTSKADPFRLANLRWVPTGTPP